MKIDRNRAAPPLANSSIPLLFGDGYTKVVNTVSPLSTNSSITDSSTKACSLIRLFAVG
jgi:hypothetical protein